MHTGVRLRNPLYSILMIRELKHWCICRQGSVCRSPFKSLHIASPAYTSAAVSRSPGCTLSELHYPEGTAQKGLTNGNRRFRGLFTEKKEKGKGEGKERGRRALEFNGCVQVIIFLDACVRSEENWFYSSLSRTGRRERS